MQSLILAGFGTGGEMATKRKAAPKGPRIDTAWFRGTLADKKLTQYGLAEALGLDKSAVSLMLRGKQQVKLEQVPVIAGYLGVSMPEVLTRLGMSDTTGTTGVPIAGWVDDQGIVHMGRVAGSQRVQTLWPLPAGACALRFQTKGLGDGQVVFYEPRTSGVPADAIGRQCVVATGPKGPFYLRWVTPGYTPGTYKLTAMGFDAPEMQSSIEWAAKVLVVVPNPH